jgi:hypothetical protein
MFTVSSILILIALVLTVAGIVWPRFPLVAVAVLLVCVALLVWRA